MLPPKDKVNHRKRTHDGIKPSTYETQIDNHLHQVPLTSMISFHLLLGLDRLKRMKAIRTKIK